MSTISLFNILLAGHWCGFNAIDLCCLIATGEHSWTNDDVTYHGSASMDNGTVTVNIYKDSEDGEDSVGSYVIDCTGITNMSVFAGVIQEYCEGRLTAGWARNRLLDGIVRSKECFQLNACIDSQHRLNETH